MDMNLQPTPVNAAIAEFGRRLMDGVREIDFASTRKSEEIECGLARVDIQFNADLAAGIYCPCRTNLKCEDIITWLLRERCCKKGEGELWVRYPGKKKTCDLVVPVLSNLQLWIEVKLASKAWFDCDSTHRKSSAFTQYLRGSTGRRNSASEDFAKLTGLAPLGACLGFLLIGFDSEISPMDREVEDLNRKVKKEGWIIDHRMWPDRRNTQFRIHCWFWRHTGEGAGVIKSMSCASCDAEAAQHAQRGLECNIQSRD